MKKIFILLLLFGILGACKKDEPVIEPIKQLPAATQRGANTGGCLVDGQAFLPNRKDLTLHYLDGEYLSLFMSKKISGSYYIVATYVSARLEVGKTYQLTELFGSDTNTGEYVISTTSPPDPRYYSTSPSVTGEVTITAHNFDKAFLSGTFWFDAVNINGEIVEIREGRFDMDY